MTKPNVIDSKRLKELFPGPCHIMQVRKAGFFTESQQAIRHHVNLMAPMRYLKEINAFPEPMTVKEMQAIAALHDIKLTRYSAHRLWEVKPAYIDRFIDNPECEYITDEELEQSYGKTAHKYIKAAGWRFHDQTKTWYAPL